MSLSDWPYTRRCHYLIGAMRESEGVDVCHRMAGHL